MKKEIKKEVIEFLEGKISSNQLDHFKDLLENKFDTTTEEFWDDKENNVYVSEYYDEGKLGYTIQIPNANIWMDSKIFFSVAEGVLIAMDKLALRDKIKKND